MNDIDGIGDHARKMIADSEARKEQRTSETCDMEDWIGSDLDQAGAVEVIRAYNGFIVRARRDESRSSQTLVFQDTDKLFDWIFNWHKQTGQTGAKK